MRRAEASMTVVSEKGAVEREEREGVRVGVRDGEGGRALSSSLHHLSLPLNSPTSRSRRAPEAVPGTVAAATRARAARERRAVGAMVE